jgi:hypothetical protein
MSISVAGKKFPNHVQIQEVPNLEQLARVRKDGLILIRPQITTSEFADYFCGKTQKGASQHKKKVLERLTIKGWGLKRILGIIKTPTDVRDFLLLHELSHLEHKDHEIKKKLSELELTQIETRACLEALLHLEKIAQN